MEQIKFYDFEFIIDNNKILLTQAGSFKSIGYDFCDVTISGENKNSHMANKIIHSSEGRNFEYISHNIKDDELNIQIKTNNLKSIINIKKINHAYLISNNLQNIKNEDIMIEEASTFKMIGFDKVDKSLIKFTHFAQSHHYECMDIEDNLDFFKYSTGGSQRIISKTNTGSWSTKEALPQGIIEYDNKYVMFNILSSNAWHYEISDYLESIYLSMGNPTINNGWSINLKPNESYQLLDVVLTFGDSLEDIINNMNDVRRHMYHPSISDKNLVPIFNEYMHLSWDSPFEKRALELSKLISSLGINYYVIDCGWHNEEPGDKIYPYVGQWIQSNNRFPRGMKFISEEFNKIGLKMGLWIEPEIIGYLCEDMLNYYDDDCFLKRNGKRIFVMNRYFLDYRNPKVIDYMTKTITRMIETYGASYIKFDYNQDVGIGVDDPSSYVTGYASANEAFFNFINQMINKYPDVIFEGCASGGMRMDSLSVSNYSLVSTSDQTNYLKYPYIVGNIFTAVIPEQAAVWSYPVSLHKEGFELDKKWINDNVSNNEVIINMVNGMLGRMHLASHLEYLNDEKISFVKEGINYYKQMVDVKINSKVLLPLGLTHFGDDVVSVGITNGKKAYLGVWTFKDHDVIIPLKQKIFSAKVGYPTKMNYQIKLLNNELHIHFEDAPMACIIELEF